MTDISKGFSPAHPMRVPMTQDEAKHAVKVFRSIYPEIPALWRALAEADALADMARLAGRDGE